MSLKTLRDTFASVIYFHNHCDNQKPAQDPMIKKPMTTISVRTELMGDMAAKAQMIVMLSL